ncbi:uncharacterized protein LOC106088119 isoform X1 [Stomoxys calcitrans]|uniref:uncharacterized protein LOC106088119 isoform X1 n=1 Tax=Stomoxys calcitrans TaxID=35570 RepID=UPI0027E370D1|nr:uncharacterized protein LOC106088119 isoform X1 [Stomoxys calcitrans]
MENEEQPLNIKAEHISSEILENDQTMENISQVDDFLCISSNDLLIISEVISGKDHIPAESGPNETKSQLAEHVLSCSEGSSNLSKEQEQISTDDKGNLTTAGELQGIEAIGDNDIDNSAKYVKNPFAVAKKRKNKKNGSKNQNCDGQDLDKPSDLVDTRILVKRELLDEFTTSAKNLNSKLDTPLMLRGVTKNSLYLNNQPQSELLVAPDAENNDNRLECLNYEPSIVSPNAASNTSPSIVSPNATSNASLGYPNIEHEEIELTIIKSEYIASEIPFDENAYKEQMAITDTSKLVGIPEEFSDKHSSEIAIECDGTETSINCDSNYIESEPSELDIGIHVEHELPEEFTTSRETFNSQYDPVLMSMATIENCSNFNSQPLAVTMIASNVANKGENVESLNYQSSIDTPNTSTAPETTNFLRIAEVFSGKHARKIAAKCDETELTSNCDNSNIESQHFEYGVVSHIKCELPVEANNEEHEQHHIANESIIFGSDIQIQSTPNCVENVSENTDTLTLENQQKATKTQIPHESKDKKQHSEPLRREYSKRRKQNKKIKGEYFKHVKPDTTVEKRQTRQNRMNFSLNEFPQPLKLETNDGENKKARKANEDIDVNLPRPIVLKKETMKYDINQPQTYKTVSLQPIVKIKRLNVNSHRQIKFGNKGRSSRAVEAMKNNSKHKATSINADFQRFVIPNPVHDRHCASQTASSSRRDSGVSSTSRNSRMDDNILLEIAAERAFINHHLTHFGYSPIQFDLYNDEHNLLNFLQYLFGELVVDDK